MISGASAQKCAFARLPRAIERAYIERCTLGLFNLGNSMCSPMK